MEKLKSDARTLVIRDHSNLKSWIEKIRRAGLDGIPLILQEQVSGATEDLYTFTAYSNTNANVVAYSIGYKIRQYPPIAGTIRCGKVMDEPEVFRLGCKLIKSLGFYGISNTEFKKDANGEFKLIEINPRPGMWTYSSTASGLNLPYIAYQESMGKKFEGLMKSGTGKVWLTLFDDLYLSVFAYPRIGYPNEKISFTEWLKSIKGEKIFAVLSLRDARPGIAFAIRLFKSRFKKL